MAVTAAMHYDWFLFRLDLHGRCFSASAPIRLTDQLIGLLFEDKDQEPFPRVRGPRCEYQLVWGGITTAPPQLLQASAADVAVYNQNAENFIIYAD